MPTTNGKPTKAELEEQRIKRLEKGHERMHDEVRKQMEHRVRQEEFQERILEQFKHVQKEFERQDKKIDDSKDELSKKVEDVKHELSGEIRETNQKVDKLASNVFKYALAIMSMNIALIVGIYAPR